MASLSDKVLKLLGRTPPAPLLRPSPAAESVVAQAEAAPAGAAVEWVGGASGLTCFKHF